MVRLVVTSIWWAFGDILLRSLLRRSRPEVGGPGPRGRFLFHWLGSRKAWWALGGLCSALSLGRVWFNIGWHGAKRFGLSLRQSFLAGGIAGVVVPALKFMLRRTPWSWLLKSASAARPPMKVFPLILGFGFLLGGLVALVGAYAARGNFCPRSHRSKG